MKKIVCSLTMALVLCLMASCGLGSTPPHLSTEAGLDSVRTLILEEAGADAKFTLLDIDGHTKRDDELGRISVISRTQVHLFSTFNWSWITSDAAEPDEEAHEVRVADLDFKPVLAGYDEVVRQVTERTSDFSRFFIYKVRVYAEEEGKCLYKLEVLGETPDERPTKYAERINIEGGRGYLLFTIEIKKDGSFSKVQGIP